MSRRYCANGSSLVIYDLSSATGVCGENNSLCLANIVQFADGSFFFLKDGAKVIFRLKMY